MEIKLLFEHYIINMGRNEPDDAARIASKTPDESNEKKL